MDVRSVAAALSVALLLGLLAGCGSGDDRIESSTADDLHRQVDAVREAVAADRDSAARSAVTELKATIRRLAGSGQLNPADGVVLLTQADRILTQVEESATPSPTPTPSAVAEPKGPADEGKGPGKAKGKDKKK